MPVLSPPPRPLPALGEARAHRGAAERLREFRRAALVARDAIIGDGPLLALASCPLITFPYPTELAFSGAARSIVPYLMLTRRMRVVQFVGADGSQKTLLFNATDAKASLSAPFAATLRKRFGAFISDQLMSEMHESVPTHLERLGLSPGDVDYLAYENLQGQDLRGWLGATPYFPRAQLLVQRTEWLAARDPHPFAGAWYVPGGAEGVAESRLNLLEGDAWLGRGVALVKTPGLTAGNQSLALATGEEMYVCSDNGVATECYSPIASHLPGLRLHSEHLGHEVVLHGNTREDSLEQYSSMVLEKLLSGPSRADPAFCNVLPSSELTASLLSPGFSPTFSHGEVQEGVIRSAIPASGGPRRG